MASPTLLLAATSTLTILYQGETRSVGDKTCTIPESAFLQQQDAPTGVEIAMFETGLGVLETKGKIVFDPDHVAEPLNAAEVIAASDREVTVLQERIPVLISDNAITVQWPREGVPDFVEHVLRVRDAVGHLRQTSWQGALRQVEGRLLSLRGAGKQVLAVELPRGATRDATGFDAELPREASAYEFSATVVHQAKFQERTSRVFAVCRFEGEGSRRVRAFEKAIAAVPAERRIVLAAGGNMPSHEGLFPQEAAVELTLATLERAQFDAYAVADEELARGIDWLKQAAEERRLPIVAANLLDASGAPVFPAYRIVRRGALAIVVVGIVPEDLVRRLPKRVLEKVKIGDIDPALTSAVRAAAAELGRAPDLYVLLGRIRGKTALDLGHGSGTFDVVIGSFETYRPSLGVHEEVEVAGDRRPGVRRPLLFARGLSLSYGRIELELAQDGEGHWLRRAVHDAAAIHSDLAPDPELVAASTSRLIESAKEGSDILLPRPEDAVAGDPELEKAARAGAVSSLNWTPELWRKLAANAAKEALEAEVAFVRPFYLSVNAGGAMSSYIVESGIDSADHTAVVYLTGAELLDLAARAIGERELIAVGLDAKARTVDGRPVHPLQRYRVVVPDHVLADEALATIFAGKPVEEGAKYGELLVARLRALRDRNGGLGPAYNEAVQDRLTTAGAGPTPLWTLGLEQIGVTYVFNRARNTEPFLLVREQRVTLPDFHHLELRGQLSATYDRRSLTWRSSTGFRFVRTYFPDLDDMIPLNQREREDAILLDTELRLKLLSLAIGKDAISLVPFLRAAYETELTPIENGTRAGGDLVVLPRRSYLSGTAGVGVFPGGVLQELKLGAIAREDFAKSQGVAFLIGLTASLRLAQPLGPLQLLLDGRLTYYPRADASEMFDRDLLGFESQSVLTVALPLTSWLNLGVFADYLVLRGMVPSTDVFGSSLQIGAKLFVDRTWKPQFEPFF